VLDGDPAALVELRQGSTTLRAALAEGRVRLVGRRDAVAAFRRAFQLDLAVPAALTPA
jgi:hypothetical protein